MPTPVKKFLRRIKLLKPCPVKHYRKEDLDFIFSLYNTDHFTQPFASGYSLADFAKAVAQLHFNLNIHRDPEDDENSQQANIVFYNLIALLQLELPVIYDPLDWRCLAMDALRYDCSEAINDLLAEYNYSDHIHNHHLYTSTSLHNILAANPDLQSEWLSIKIGEIKQFLSAQKLDPEIADEYFSMVRSYALK
jgi:hypothetical protein